jgi:hypothetical protein
MGGVAHRGHAELRADQVRAAHEFPPPYRERAIGFLEAGHRDLVLCQEQLLLAMRLVIEHGQPRPCGEIDKLGLARLRLGATDLMVSGEGLEAGAADDVTVALALRRGPRGCTLGSAGRLHTQRQGVSTDSARGRETMGKNRINRIIQKRLAVAELMGLTARSRETGWRNCRSARHERYFSNCRAMTTRWIWLVPS